VRRRAARHPSHRPLGGLTRLISAVVFVLAYVDAHTLVLLFGMMIVTAYLRLSGFFRLVTTWMASRARTPFGLLVAVVLASGVPSTAT
jgi:Na+/H+ antiporter NhaD/arsenite permease-like protein